MKIAIYQHGDHKIYLDPVENTVSFPPTIFIDNKMYNFHMHYLCSTKTQIKNLKDHFLSLNIEHNSYSIFN